MSRVISTPATQPCSALNRTISGGLPPVESPSPTVSTRPVEIRVATILVTEGALNPDARTKSAFEQGPDSRSNRSRISAFVWRIRGGRPTSTGFRVTIGSPRSFLGHRDVQRRS